MGGWNASITGAVTGRVGAGGAGKPREARAVGWEGVARGAGGAGGFKRAEDALLDAWCLAARRHVFSLCAGPQWHGRVRRRGVGGLEEEEGGRLEEPVGIERSLQLFNRKTKIAGEVNSEVSTRGGEAEAAVLPQTR